MNGRKSAMRRSLAAVFALLLAAVSLVAAAPTAAAAPYCGIYWGSFPKTAPSNGTAPELANVRAGQHACYDRIVLDTARSASWYRVSYVTQVTQVTRSDVVVPLRGGARLLVAAQVADGDTIEPPFVPNGSYVPANVRELVNVAGYRTLRQVAWAGSYEGYTQIGVGVRARLPFRVFVLAGPGSGSRIVIDVAHRW